MTTLKKIFVVLATLGLMIPSFAFADDFGLKDASQGTGLIKQGENINAQTSVPELIGTIVGVALSFLGALFFLLILYAGILWMTSFGNTEKAEKAKGILEHAAIGLVIVLAAYAISTFVFNALGVGGGSPSPQGGSSQAAGTICGNNSVINNGGACVTQCEFEQAGICQDQSISCAKPYIPSLCPGVASNSCCPS